MRDKGENESIKEFLQIAIDNLDPKNEMVIMQTIDYLELYEEPFEKELYKLLDKFGIDYEGNK